MPTCMCISIVVIVLVFVIWVYFRFFDDPLGDVVAASVKRGDVQETVTSLGKLQPAKYVDVGAQASGQLKRLHVKAGDHVNAGDLVAEIDPQLQAAAVESTEAELERLRATLIDARAQTVFSKGELQRQTQLAGENATRADIYAQVRRDARSAEAREIAIRAQIRQAASTLKANRSQLSYTRIYAPIAGTVVSVDVREGQTVNATFSAPSIMRIADLATMTVWTQVSEADVTRLRVGMPLWFTTLGFGERRWRSILKQILPSPPSTSAASGPSGGTSSPPGSGNVVLYTALLDVANDGGLLRPEMSAQVFFITGAVRDVPLVPMAALTPVDEVRNIYAARVLRGRSVENRRITIGVHDRFTAEVRSGLSVGDQIVTGSKAGAEGPSRLGFSL